jgi:hypothetical protein
VTNSAAESDDSFPEANGATTTKPYVSTTARLEPPQGVTASRNVKAQQHRPRGGRVAEGHRVKPRHEKFVPAPG